MKKYLLVVIIGLSASMQMVALYNWQFTNKLDDKKEITVKVDGTLWFSGEKTVQYGERADFYSDAACLTLVTLKRGDDKTEAKPGEGTRNNLSIAQTGNNWACRNVCVNIKNNGDGGMFFEETSCQ